MFRIRNYFMSISKYNWSHSWYPVTFWLHNFWQKSYMFFTCFAFYQNSDMFYYMEHILAKLRDLKHNNHGCIGQTLAVNVFHPVMDT